MRTRLIGFYGKYVTGALGTAISTGDLEESTYYVTVSVGVEGVTGLPDGAEAGYVFLSDDTTGETLGVGDSVKKITMTDLCDTQSWSLEFSKGEVDVTTLCDDQNKYLAGRTDATGSIEGVYTIDTTDIAGGIANGFFDIVRQVGPGGVITIDKIHNDNIFAILYKQKDTTTGEKEQFYMAPATITSFSDSVSGSDAQAFSSSFRIAPNDDVKFQLVSITR